MAKNYDDWERLVAAVLRRERDRQIALSHSRDPSSVSSLSHSSFSSTPRFDLASSHHLPVDHSDLTVHHSGWKAMLPPGKQEVVWRSACLSFSLDQRTGKNCFLVGAAKVVHGYNWEMKSHPKSRFSEVAELIQSWNIDIRGRINMQMLTPETLYAAYLVFGLTDKYAKFEWANSIIRFFHDNSNHDSSKEQVRRLHFQTGNSRHSRADGWMEQQLGDFYVGEEDNLHVEARLLEEDGHTMQGLIVEGIEFRPLMKTTIRPFIRRGKGVFSNLRITG